MWNSQEHLFYRKPLNNYFWKRPRTIFSFWANSLWNGSFLIRYRPYYNSSYSFIKSSQKVIASCNLLVIWQDSFHNALQDLKKMKYVFPRLLIFYPYKLALVYSKCNCSIRISSEIVLIRTRPWMIFPILTFPSTV